MQLPGMTYSSRTTILTQIPRPYSSEWTKIKSFLVLWQKRRSLNRCRDGKNHYSTSPEHEANFLLMPLKGVPIAFPDAQWERCMRSIGKPVSNTWDWQEQPGKDQDRGYTTQFSLLFLPLSPLHITPYDQLEAYPSQSCNYNGDTML